MANYEDQPMEEYEEEDYSDEEGMDEGDEQQIREIGAHPMMERVQVALHAQLKNEDTRLDLESLEKNEALKRIKKRREDVGVDLYTVQQQLAKLQMQLESTIKEHADIAAVRVDTESDTVADRARLEQIREQVKVEQRKLTKHQTELDAVNTTLQQVEQYNEETKQQQLAVGPWPLRRASAEGRVLVPGAVAALARQHRSRAAGPSHRGAPRRAPLPIRRECRGGTLGEAAPASSLSMVPP